MVETAAKPTCKNYHDCAIIFIHIPKAAGTTLKHIIERQYRRSEIFSIREKLAGKSLEEFRQLPDEVKRPLKIVKGHINFGVHDALPQASTYITVIRDPIERICSHYYYVLRMANHYLHDQVVAQQMSLKDYVCSGISLELDNCQTRVLASGEAGGVPFGECSTETLELAKQHLQEHFAVVGIAERFDETLVLLKELFGWSMPFYARLNVTQNRPKLRSLPDADLAAIRQQNQIDLELYRFANQLLDEQIQQHVKFFKLKLYTFKILNRLYNLKIQFQQRAT